MKLEQTTAFEMVETFVRKNVPSYIHEIILLKELDDSYSYQCAFSTSTQELPLPTEFASIFFFVDNIHGPGKPRLTYRLEETTMIRSPEDGLGFSEKMIERIVSAKKQAHVQDTPPCPLRTLLLEIGRKMMSNKTYYDQYMTSKFKKSPSILDNQKLMTDRNAYIAFLEAQLERVSSACMEVQSYNDKIADMQAQISKQDDKINNLTRLIKLNHNLSEQQEKDFKTLRSTVAKKITENDDVVQNLKAQVVDVGRKLEISNNEQKNEISRHSTELQSQIQRLTECRARDISDSDGRFAELDGKILSFKQSIDTRLQANHVESLERVREGEAHGRALARDIEELKGVVTLEATHRENSVGKLAEMIRLTEETVTKVSSDAMFKVDKQVENLHVRLEQGMATLREESEATFQDVTRRILQERQGELDRIGEMERQLERRNKDVETELEGVRQLIRSAEGERIRGNEDMIGRLQSESARISESDTKMGVMQRSLQSLIENRMEDTLNSVRGERRLHEESNRAEIAGLERRISTRMEEIASKVNVLIGQQNQAQNDVHDLKTKSRVTEEHLRSAMRLNVEEGGALFGAANSTVHPPSTSIPETARASAAVPGNTSLSYTSHTVMPSASTPQVPLGQHERPAPSYDTSRLHGGSGGGGVGEARYSIVTTAASTTGGEMGNSLLGQSHPSQRSEPASHHRSLAPTGDANAHAHANATTYTVHHRSPPRSVIEAVADAPTTYVVEAVPSAVLGITTDDPEEDEAQRQRRERLSVLYKELMDLEADEMSAV